MNPTLTSPAQMTNNHNSIERRLKPRIREDFIARVRGQQPDGNTFIEHALVENLSSTGLYTKLGRTVLAGSKIFIILQFVFPAIEKETGLLIAFRGEVVRAEPDRDSSCGVAVRFINYRFLSRLRAADFFETLVSDADARAT